jgi:hypothetical protein
MTKRILDILMKRVIDKNIGAYSTNGQKSILVTWNMSLFQRIISARGFRVRIFGYGGMQVTNTAKSVLTSSRARVNCSITG